MAKRKRKRRRRRLGCGAVAVLCILGLVCGAFAARAVLRSLYPVRYDEFVETYTEEYGLEKSFALAVIQCESGFDPNAVSSVGACGLMQLMPETFEWLQTKTGETLSDDALFLPETSVRYGCLMLSLLLRQFPEPHTAVCAYHAGMGNVENWLRDPRYSDDGRTLKAVPFPTTERYAERVLRTQKIYQLLYQL